MVDRNNLGRQTFKEFKQYVTPDDGRKFTELYNVQHLQSNTIDPVNKVCITTIQRLFSMLKGESGIDSELEEMSIFDLVPPDEKQMEVSYNPEILLILLLQMNVTVQSIICGVKSLNTSTLS